MFHTAQVLHVTYSERAAVLAQRQHFLQLFPRPPQVLVHLVRRLARERLAQVARVCMRPMVAQQARSVSTVRVSSVLVGVPRTVALLDGRLHGVAGRAEGVRELERRVLAAELDTGEEGSAGGGTELA